MKIKFNDFLKESNDYVGDEIKRKEKIIIYILSTMKAEKGEGYTTTKVHIKIEPITLYGEKIEHIHSIIVTTDNRVVINTNYGVFNEGGGWNEIYAKLIEEIYNYFSKEYDMDSITNAGDMGLL